MRRKGDRREKRKMIAQENSNIDHEKKREERDKKEENER